jgi:ferredoxin-NADP reductase
VGGLLYRKAANPPREAKRKGKNSLTSQKAITWHHLLRLQDHHAFLGWLQESGREREALRDVAPHLADFLIQQIEEVQTEWPDAPRRQIQLCGEKS